MIERIERLQAYCKINLLLDTEVLVQGHVDVEETRSAELVSSLRREASEVVEGSCVGVHKRVSVDAGRQSGALATGGGLHRALAGIGAINRGGAIAQGGTAVDYRERQPGAPEDLSGPLPAAQRDLKELIAELVAGSHNEVRAEVVADVVFRVAIVECPQAERTELA